MTEDEFWNANAAMVWELTKARDQFDRRRDFFVSLLVSHSSEVPYEDILSCYYSKQGVTVTHDPELGASLSSYTVR